MPVVRTFYSPNHAAHHPPLEFLHGRQVPYFEMPRRIDNLRQAVEGDQRFALEIPPLTIPREAITCAHDAAMVTYLETLAQNVQNIIRADFGIYHMGDQLTGDEYYYESNFPKRARPDAAGRQFYLYDTVSPVGKHTFDAALHAANLAYHGALALRDGERVAYALCRPPGHHAGRDFMGGYCYLNNAAIAAYALMDMGKVAVLDVDYHHGNGTQDIFWDEPRALFASIHADPLQDYPYYSGFVDDHAGMINLPLPHGSGEAAYLTALHTALAGIQAFGPAALVVSLGFDTFNGDPISSFQLDIASYEKIGRAVAALNLPTLYVQEGGYAVDQLGDMALSLFTGVLG
jgi:acetoin utilization deacetylase AcuC-like enzyme